MALSDVISALPTIGGAAGVGAGVPLSLWRVWKYVDQQRASQLKEEIGKRKEAEAKLATAENAEDAARIARIAAQEVAATAMAEIGGLTAKIRWLTDEIAQLRGRAT